MGLINLIKFPYKINKTTQTTAHDRSELKKINHLIIQVTFPFPLV